MNQQDPVHEDTSLFAIDMGNISDDELVEQLMFQMSNIGFCLLTNVPGHNEEEMLEAIKAFHQIPLEDKMKLAPNHYCEENKNKFHGYFPFIERDMAHKEFYDIARPMTDLTPWEYKGAADLYEDAPWPERSSELGIDWVKEKFYKQFYVMHSLSLRLLRALSKGLGKREDYFDPWFKDQCSSVWRGIHYRPRDQSVVLEDPLMQKLTAPEHADSGFITLLSTFNYPGLQVEIDGEYKSIKPMKNAVIMNIGETLQKISGHQIKATRHRVIDIGIERYSSPFFLEPKHSARIGDGILDSNRYQSEDFEYD